jgi:hypothetical protein
MSIIKIYSKASLNIRNKDTYSFGIFLPEKKILRKMGLLKDQDGILRRYLNETVNWHEHLECTKQTIIDFIKQNQAKSVSILGSGWMFDLPVRFLTEELERVVFYDLRHPPGVISKYGRNTKFRFVAADLTGGLIAKVFQLCSQKYKPGFEALYAELSNCNITLPQETECYISVNLLNQLDILLVDYLKSFFVLTDDNIRVIREVIQENHLSFLKKHTYCLITDFEEIHLNDADEVIDYTPLVYTALPKGEHQNTWIWHFDTNKTYHPGQKTFMRVTAIY